MTSPEACERRRTKTTPHGCRPALTPARRCQRTRRSLDMYLDISVSCSCPSTSAPPLTCHTRVAVSFAFSLSLSQNQPNTNQIVSQVRSGREKKRQPNKPACVRRESSLENRTNTYAPRDVLSQSNRNRAHRTGLRAKHTRVRAVVSFVSSSSVCARSDVFLYSSTDQSQVGTGGATRNATPRNATRSATRSAT